MTTQPISRQIEPLLSVQELDNRIAELQAERATWPERIGEVRTLLDEIDQRLAALQERRQGLQVERDRLNLEVEEEFQRVQTYEKQLREIKTNREYQALIREIGISKKARADAEEALIKVMEELEEVEAEIERVQERRSEVAGQLEELEAAFAKEAERIDAEVAELNRQREAAAADVPRQILSRYDLVRRRYTNVVVRAEAGLCTGCHRQLPPQTFNLVLRDDRLITCPVCHRILLPPAPAEAGQES